MPPVPNGSPVDTAGHPWYVRGGCARRRRRAAVSLSPAAARGRPVSESRMRHASRLGPARNRRPAWRPAGAAVLLSVLFVAAARSQTSPASGPTTAEATTGLAATTQASPTQPSTSQAATTQAVPTQPTTVPATAAAPSVPTPTDRAVPIPLNKVAIEAERNTGEIRAIEADLAADPLPGQVSAELPGLADEVAARLAENGRLMAANTSLEALRSLEQAWAADADTLGDWKKDLDKRGGQIEKHVLKMRELDDGYWRPSVAHPQMATAPPEVVRRAQAMLDLVARTRQSVEKARDKVLSLQNAVGEQDAKAGDAITAVRAARAASLNRVLVRDSPPIWDALADPAASGQAVVATGQQTLGAQVAELRAYAARRGWLIALHAASLLAVLPAVLAARRRVAPWVKEDGSLRRAAAVFDTPFSTTGLLVLMASQWLYPHAPRMFMAALGAAALVPTVVILRRLLERRLFPVLYALVGFYAADQVRSVAAAQPLLARMLLMVEMALGALFLVWLIQSGRLSKAVGADEDEPLGKWIVALTRLSGVVFVGALVADALGFVVLATLLGNAMLGSAYLAVILYAASRIVDGLLMAALRVRPLVLLKMVREHRKLFWQRAQPVVRWAAVLLWLVVTLDLLNVRDKTVGFLKDAWAAGVTAGTFSLTLGQLVTFGITVWAAVMVSRFTRFILEEDVYPRFQLARGLPYAISTVLHYVILVVGFVAAVGALGYDLTKFTILAGAFGVGLGFGLQNIFNNFVSGLILLFERPIKVGDVVQIGDAVGVVRRIGIRASVVRTSAGAEVILPNGKLISDPVTNWTLSSRGRGIELALGTAGSADPRVVMSTWAKVALRHPKVAEDPPPKATMTGFGGDALRFELRAWTTEFESWADTRSDLAIAMNAALTEAGIAIK